MLFFCPQKLLMLYCHPFVFSKVSRIGIIPLANFFFSFNASVFFFNSILFFNRKVGGFSCEKMLLNWTCPVSIPEYLFHGKSGKKKWRESFFYKHTLFPTKGFFLMWKEKKILQKKPSMSRRPCFEITRFKWVNGDFFFQSKNK